MSPHTVAPLLLGLAVIVVTAWLLGMLARRLGQPAVIGEIVGGILLGPTLFGGAIPRTLFPAEVRPSLTLLADIGVCLFMFLIGLHLDHTLLRGQSRTASVVSVCAMLLPFGLGALLALYLAGGGGTGDRVAFVLFMGAAMAVTAFPVLARILTDKGLIDTPIGGLALACAAVGDVLAWALLAVVAALAGGGGHPWRVLFVVPFAAVLLGVVRPLLARLAARRPVSGPLTGVVLVAGAAGLLLSAQATSWMGLHAIFGAFLFGVAMPREGVSALRERVLPWIERICAVVLLPVFFMAAGLKVDLSRLDTVAFGELALILLVAVTGKFGGAYLGARITGVRPRHSAVLGILMNTRGLTELIVLIVGLELGVLTPRLYSLMILMALVTTAMTGVLLRIVYPERRVVEDRSPRTGATQLHVNEGRSGLSDEY
ncbi:cation:proton antiporter [Microbispora sp. H10949]|uniref:cation:proton antiporter n=1 Tax=Microbispora sp. H10949 TaxID=2729111 RepID=UPI0015FF4729|nr:cation:proton antiporter [Microbispora sp. H10949]